MPAFGQEVVRPGSESAPTLTFAADGVPKRLTIKRGTKITLTGNLPTSALSATVQLRQGSRVLAQEHVSSDWKLVWDSAQYPGGSCALSVILVDARGQDIRLGSTFITLFDSPPVALVRPLRDTSTIDKLVLHAAVEQDDLDVEKYEVFVDDDDAHISLDGKGFGSISLAGKIPGIHTIKVRVLLGYGAGELFTESVPIQLRALAQILVPVGGAKVDLRTSNKDTAFPLSVSIDPAVHAKSVGYIIDDQPVGFSEKSPAFDGVAMGLSSKLCFCTFIDFVRSAATWPPQP